jgi:cellulose synthase/poly-beta-1,6-N-acetylglucosamine synthase-like glycosyltransferase
LLDYPDFELILVDNRRTTPHPDPLTEMVKDRLWLKVVRESKPGISAARNKGVAESTGEFIAFTDDDVYVDRQWLRAIGTRFMRDPALDAVSGLILPSELESPAQIWFERYYGGFNGQRSFEASTLEAGGSRSKFLRGSRIVVRNDKGIEIKKFSIYGVGAYAAGANMAFRKSALERIGGFDVALGTGTPARGGEDLAAVISTLWTGGRLGFEPSALAHHRHRREYSELLTLMDGNGIGFTALLTSLVRNDPRHLLGLGSQLSLGIRQIIVQRARKIRGVAKGTSSAQSTEPLFPAELAHREFRAYLRGPAAYFKSRRVWSRLENDKG